MAEKVKIITDVAIMITLRLTSNVELLNVPYLIGSIKYMTRSTFQLSVININH